LGKRGKERRKKERNKPFFPTLFFCFSHLQFLSPKKKKATKARGAAKAPRTARAHASCFTPLRMRKVN
jgi:hypothetical protein